MTGADPGQPGQAPEDSPTRDDDGADASETTPGSAHEASREIESEPHNATEEPGI